MELLKKIEEHRERTTNRRKIKKMKKQVKTAAMLLFTTIGKATISE